MSADWPAVHRNSLKWGSGSAHSLRLAVLCRAALLAVIAVLGEIAAVFASSAMHFGPAVTGVVLGGVVLTAVWPLRRFAVPAQGQTFSAIPHHRPR